ncbi:pseudoazurin [uncultured Cohaesibacter sp.]|uniref:pseudoazurin n=1 Tax=uncultured Cohaesibacter sp. TaxID=1002546 RepID=UPI0029C797AF|nr:pseudoazurin [uncultured Cohaesibacter sp.]
MICFSKASLALSVFLIALPVTAFAETHYVKMLNRNETGVMPFEPDYLAIKPGDQVKFLATDSGHNAATIKEMIPEGGKKFIGKINQEIEVTFDVPGIWGIKCSPHYAMGMVMLIQVGDTPATANDLSSKLPKKAKERMEEILSRQSANQ